jgi:UDP-glucose 4-epimerase
MQVLVTGGTGYIGSHTVVELQKNGFDALIVDSLANSNADVVDRIESITGTRPRFEQFDLCDAARTEQFFCDHPGLEAVIHFAAFKSVYESVRKPLKYYYNNLVSTINLLDSMALHSVTALAFSSSCTVYGQPDELPVTEKAPIKKAESPYGDTKQMMERIIETMASSGAMRAISLRYFNPIGAHESALIGETPATVPDNLVPYLTQTAAGIRPFLRVFGNDYNTPDGTPVRDYIHVTDLARAHVAALKRLVGRKTSESYEVFNLGTGTGYSVLEVIRAFERVSGLKLEYQILDRRPGDIEKVWADTRLANVVLGWKAEKDLDEMMRSAWEWQKKGGFGS